MALPAGYSLVEPEKTKLPAGYALVSDVESGKVKFNRTPFEPTLSPEEQMMGAVGAPSEGGIASIAPRQEALPPSTGGANAMTADEYRAQVAAREAEGYDRTVGGTAIDAGVTFLKSAIGFPEAVVGLLDIPTLGYAGKLLEKAGYKPKEAKQILDTYLSEAQQYANRQVKETKGFFPTIGAALQNPSTIVTSVVESLPQMLGGAGIARGLTSLAPAVAPYLAGAIGEGILGAGSAAEQMRQESKEGLLTPKQALAALGSGAGTTAFGVAGGKLAHRLGLEDIDTLLVKGTTSGVGSKSVKDFAKRATASGISEGVFEELPQSAQEQMWMNYAQDKPLMDGVAEAAGMGLVTGATMGVGATAIAGRAKEPEREKYVKPEGGLAEIIARQKGFLTPQEKTTETSEADITAFAPQPQAPVEQPPVAPVAPVSEEEAPAQDLDAMLKEALGATQSDTNTVSVAEQKPPVVEAPPVEQPASTKLVEEVLPQAPKAELNEEQVKGMTDEQLKAQINNISLRDKEYELVKAEVENRKQEPASTKLVEEVMPKEPEAKNRPSTPEIYNGIIDGWQGNANKLPDATRTWMTENGLIKGGNTTPLGQRLMTLSNKLKKRTRALRVMGSLKLCGAVNRCQLLSP